MTRDLDDFWHISPVEEATAAWFDDLYAEDPDPWGFATSADEHDKYRATIRALDGRRYASGFEAGCSIGVLTVDLAATCDQLLAVDASQIALVHARARTRALPNVRLERAVLPQQWPAGPFDLIVLSEIGYYFDRPILRRAVDAAVASLQPGGDLIAVHSTGPLPGHPSTGDEVHEALLDHAGLAPRVGQREATYRLDVLTRR